ncbi:3-isopropylmalate dehydratase [Ectopseudomonas mendocina]|uniref:3-isopropylmalate dehydratase n=1 Tax=Ectopseudomonas mendocina TaxID=300 RepID=A0ABZ2RJ45_ECTME
MRLIGAALVLSLVTGCSSWQVALEDIRPVPEDRLLSYQQPVENGGQITVARDKGGMGAGCYISVLIDRKVAARIATTEEAHFQVPAGTRVLGIGIDKADDTLCSKGRLNLERAVKVEPGSQQRFRIRTDNMKGVYISPVDQ